MPPGPKLKGAPPREPFRGLTTTPLLANLGCLARNPKQQLKADRDSTCSELFNTQLHLKNHGFQSLGAATRHRACFTFVSAYIALLKVSMRFYYLPPYLCRTLCCSRSNAGNLAYLCWLMFAIVCKINYAVCTDVDIVALCKAGLRCQLPNAKFVSVWTVHICAQKCTCDFDS